MESFQGRLQKGKTHVDVHKRLHFLMDIASNTFHIRLGGLVFFFLSFFPFSTVHLGRQGWNMGTQKSTGKVFKKLRGVEAPLGTTRPCS